MSTGGVFMIITNDGRQDKILLATELLQKRISNIKAAKEASNKAGTTQGDTTPTLMEIEQTHVLFVNAHFKPFAAIGFEYTVVRPTGNVQFGNDVQFSLPQFGEFLADAMIRVVTKASTVTPGVNATLEGVNSPVLRWCDFPGERILQQVKIDINGNPLDQYNWETYVFHRQFELLPNKRLGWSRAMGQQVADDAILDEDAHATSLSNEFHIAVTQGPQTWKSRSQEGLELMVPLMFWFNKDPRVALPSVAIPFGQRYITVTLAQADQLMYIRDRGAAITEGKEALEYSNGTSTFSTPDINSMELYINNLFVLPEIHDIYIKRVGFSLIRVYRRQITNLTKSQDEIRLNAMKWPIEYMYIGASPSSNTPHFAHWHRFAVPSKQQYDLPNFLSSATSYHYNSGNVTATAASVTATGYVYNQVFDTFRIRLQGVNLYNDYSSMFYNTYLPLAYGGININTPEDVGLLFVPFCIYPRIYQPSGYINVSRAREFDAIYNSSWIGSSNGSSQNTANMLVQGSAINFLIIAQSNASLRYST